MTEDRWSLHPGVEIRWVAWPDGHLLYQRSSGETHYLNEVGAELLRRLDDSPRGLRALAEPLPSDPAEADALLETMRAVLARLDELGLADRHRGPP